MKQPRFTIGNGLQIYHDVSCIGQNSTCVGVARSARAFDTSRCNFLQISGSSLCPAPTPHRVAMAPHLTPVELDLAFQMQRKGKHGVKMHQALVRKRARSGTVAPTLHRFRKALRGITYRRSHKETRGRKRKLTRKNVLKMNSTRKRLIKQAQNNREVRWEDVRKASRVPQAHRSTLKRAFKCEGLPVQARPPRQKPARSPEQAKARVAHCKKWCC